MRYAKIASPIGQKTMKPITIRAIQAGLPKSSMRATTSDIAIHLQAHPSHVNVYNIYMAKRALFVKGVPPRNLADGFERTPLA